MLAWDPGAQPAIVARPKWGADEGLRFDSAGAEITPPSFWPVQKLIVHHTAGRNEHLSDPGEAVRWMQRFHVLERDFGDIAYNFLVDREGAIYEGRYSPFSASGEAPPGHDPEGRVVAATHTLGYNAGTASVALLGNFVEAEPEPEALSALTGILAWLTRLHGLDPTGEGSYRNPVSGIERGCPNIAGHGELMKTLCPGARLSARLPSIRAEVAATIAPA